MCSIAIDCEMVGVNLNGSESAVARVSIVNYHGHILLDTFVRPKERITDFRTWISGVREEDLYGAPGLEEVQAKVAELCEGRVLVGHAIDNDLKVGGSVGRICRGRLHLHCRFAVRMLLGFIEIPLNLVIPRG
jgi:DNA polymerase III epsilon subunit-like protein